MKKILVTAKRIIDPEHKFRLLPDGSHIDPTGASFRLNPFCENAIEAAIVLGENAEVILLTIGGEGWTTTIRTALAMGVTRAIHVTIPEENLDCDLTARLMAAIWEKEKPDLTLMGKQAIDTDSAQVGPLLAHYTKCPIATGVREIRLEEKQLHLVQDTDTGRMHLLLPLPAIVTVDRHINTPRMPSLPNILKAKRKPLAIIDSQELGVDMHNKVLSTTYRLPEPRQPGQILPSVDQLLDCLKTLAP